MKHLKNSLLAAVALLMVGSCSDDNMPEGVTDKSESVVTRSDYLASFGPLKTYINRNVNPGFKLGTGVSVYDYIAKGFVYNLINSNYDEMTAGWEMKHGAVVQQDGSLNFNLTKNFISVAQQAGLTIYGHTLCWHSNQNAVYLNRSLGSTVYYANGSGSTNGGYALTFTNPSVVGYWEAQTCYDLSSSLINGKKYVVKFMARATSNGTIRAEMQTPGDYSSADSYGSFNLTTSWKAYEGTATITAGGRARLTFSFGDYAGTVFIDNIALCEDGSSNSIISNGTFENGTTSGWIGWGNNSTRGISAYGTGFGSNGTGWQIIEKSAAEKSAIVNEELRRWIEGMMGVSKSYVKVWDVVNEPMADWPDPSQLKTGIGKTNLPIDEFYWQDYLGKDYARKAIAYARQYGGNDMVLFINDYGLESPSQTKCQGLINYIKYLESDGVTKVDGIGTQMHVTLRASQTDQIAQENAIDKMFQAMAATGKLVKVSEVDMGIEGTDGKNIKTENASFDQLYNQAVFYKFIVKSYYRNVPVYQRYGITHWSPTDSPEGSGWRPSEPIGLWDLNYNRKPAYGGFADGLANN